MIKKKFILSVSAVSILLAACDENTVTIGEDNNPKVYSSGEKIFYSGDISYSGFNKVEALSNITIKTLVINSRGGDIVPSMKLGELVFDNKWNVQVQDYCFSSCANYIFPAGKIKYLAQKSQLGWHGGATQQFSDDIVPKDESERKMFIKMLTGLIKTETIYFKKINVNQLSTVYGQVAEKHLEILTNHDSDCKGWSYSIDGLSAFGINNVVLMDDEWNPAPSHEKICIHRFDKVDIK